MKTPNTALEILRLLKEETDQEHVIPQTRIAERFEMDRKTVKRCFEDMPSPYKDSIVTTKKGVYYELGEFDFSLYEVRMLVDSVLASRVISSKETDELLKKLARLLNKHDRKHVKHIYAYKDWSKIENVHASWPIEILDEAISSKCYVSFVYNEIGLDKKLKPVETCVVAPIQMVFSNGKYYLLAIRENSEEIESFRVDKINKAKVIERKVPRNVSSITYDVASYVEQHPNMMHGKIGSVDLLIEKKSIERLFDSFGFGENVRVSPLRNDGNSVKVVLKANLEEIFVWALQNADVAEVIKPIDLREQLMQALRAAKNKYLSTSEDIYLAEMHKLTNSEEFENQPERATMDFSDIDLTQFDTYKNIDVCKYRFWKVKLEDISFVAGKKLLQSFYSFENPIADYLPLAEAENLQDISIIFSDIDSLEFVPKCRCLRSLTLGGTKIKDATAIYQTLCPQLEYLKLFWGSEIDVELFKKFNPKTKVIVGRKEAEDRDNQIHLMDVNERFTKYEYPLNVIDSSLGLEAHEASAKEIEEIRQKLVVNQEAFAKIEQQLFRTETTRAVVTALYYEGKSILEVACDLSMTIPEVLKTRKIATRIHTDEFLEVEHDFISKHRGEVTEEDVAWFKNLMEEYQLKKNREKYN